MSQPKRRALVIDDDPQISSLLCAFLGLNGWSAAHVPTLRAALASLKSSPVHLVLLDLNLPDSSPSESLLAIPALKLAGCDKVLVITGMCLDTPQWEKAMKESGSDGWAEKLSGNFPDKVLEAVRLLTFST